ncbi:MAG: UbiA family prenyltransferase [Candidatus Methanomethylicaceae archaeon]
MTTILRPFRVYFEITRSYSPLLMCAGAFLGMIISRGVGLDFWESLIPLASLYFLTSASFVFNDIFDLETDKVNGINRPLSAGELSFKSAWVLWALLEISGLGLLTYINHRGAALLLIFSYGLSLLYTLKIKEYGLLGNVLVSLFVSLSIIYGALSIDGKFPLPLLSLVYLAFLLNLAREVIQGIADAPGDAVKNVRSFSRIYGAKRAKIFGITLFSLMLISAPLVINASGSNLFRNHALIYGYIFNVAGFSYALYKLYLSSEKDVRRVLKIINLLTASLIALLLISLI